MLLYFQLVYDNANILESIFTAIVLFILSVKAEKHFGLRGKLPTITSTPKGTYGIIILFLLLWISSLVALCIDWPIDSSGNYIGIQKREFNFLGSSADAGLQGISWGCFSIDFVFMYVPGPKS